MSRASSWRERKSQVIGAPMRLALYFHSSAPRRQTYTNAIISSTTNVDGLDHRERAERAQLDGDRVEEDHLDVEQDEQHRDQVEADPEAEAALDLGRKTALVGLLLGAVRRAPTRR